MAQPIMFSATTTGPEIEKMEPFSWLSFEAILEVEVDCVEVGAVEVVEVDEAGESGRTGSSGGDGGDGVDSVGVDGRLSSSRLPINSSKDGCALSRGLPSPNMKYMVIE